MLAIHVPFLATGSISPSFSLGWAAGFCSLKALDAYVNHGYHLEKDLTRSIEEMCAARNYPETHQEAVVKTTLDRYQNITKSVPIKHRDKFVSATLDTVANSINKNNPVQYPENPELPDPKLTDPLKYAGLFGLKLAGFGQHIRGGFAVADSFPSALAKKSRLQNDVEDLLNHHEIEDEQARKFYHNRAKQFFKEAQHMDSDPDRKHPHGSALLRTQQAIAGGTYQSQQELQPATASL